jgi:hypothetical protein
MLDAILPGRAIRPFVIRGKRACQSPKSQMLTKQQPTITSCFEPELFIREWQKGKTPEFREWQKGKPDPGVSALKISF